MICKKKTGCLKAWAALWVSTYKRWVCVWYYPSTEDNTSGLARLIHAKTIYEYLFLHFALPCKLLVLKLDQVWNKWPQNEKSVIIYTHPRPHHKYIVETIGTNGGYDLLRLTVLLRNAALIVPNPYDYNLFFEKQAEMFCSVFWLLVSISWRWMWIRNVSFKK